MTLTAFSRLAPLRTTAVYDTFWHFATERQAIFYRRLQGAAPPWTVDPILREHKFTNAYRASDRVSQYLIKHVIYTGDQSTEEVFFRTILFKLFNKISTWELLRRELQQLTYNNFDVTTYDRILTRALDHGTRIYSAAYIMPSGGFGQTRKHQNHLLLLQQMMSDRLPARIAASKRLQDVFELLRSYPTIGNFLAYQYAIDLNYSTIIDFNENTFVVPGPGALDGIKKCFHDLAGLNEANIITIVNDRQHTEFAERGLHFQTLFGRPLHLIDTQNLFCEISKYARIAHPEIKGVTDRTRIKQRYRPITEPLSVWYPPKWGINHHITKGQPDGPAPISA